MDELKKALEDRVLVPGKCDCEALTKILMDLRQSLREEEAAVDAYFERGNRAEKKGALILADLYHQHILPEEQQHFMELATEETRMIDKATECQCPSLKVLLGSWRGRAA
jgi:hypothetical protein